MLGVISLATAGPKPFVHKLFVSFVIVLGLVMLALGFLQWRSTDPVRGYFFILLALVASGMRMQLPQLVGTLSVNFVFVLLGILELSLSETLVMGCAATAVQVGLHRQASRIPAPAAFHVANTAIAATIAYRAYHGLNSQASDPSLISLALAATILYAMNTLPVAIVFTLAQNRSLGWVWRECNFRAFPYYLAGGVAAGLFHYSAALLGGHSPLLLMPVGFLAYCSYHSYTQRLAVQRAHIEEMALLHQRTIESLAMAIEAKDQAGALHLRRLRLYCVEIAHDLGLDQAQIDALQAASVLHDVGKLAVPEHILSKAGRLTREEFDKIKIHPVVGAEIVERVHFPYPVAEIVRHHHEKWNGGGYPDGLKGDAIPIGARLLAVVDSFDSLLSERSYRPAKTAEEALRVLEEESGVSFDPKLVQILRRRQAELETRLRLASVAEYPPAQSLPAASPGAPSELPNGNAPAPFLDSIAAAGHEAQVLLELTQELGTSLHLDETLAVLSTGLRRIVRFDSMVIYIKQDDALVSRYASGEYASLFLSNEVKQGQGVAGWVALHAKPILNGNPMYEMGGGSSNGAPLLDSALAVPLTTEEGVVGVLMLCRRGVDAFSKDHLRLLLAVSAKLGVVVENALRYEQAAASASTDFLTGLPNARALELQLESELARGKRLSTSLTILVTDLDGFKDVNDRFGHLEGNAVLRAVAKALRQSCREYDYVARMGGDEFVLLLPGLPPEDLSLKIAQLNNIVIEVSRRVVPDSRIALSVGHSRFPDDGQDPGKLLEDADQRMYKAKAIRKMKSTYHNPRGFDFDWSESTKLK